MSGLHDHPTSVLVDHPASSLPGDAFETLLALADDELIIGHRHSEWLGLSPFLEEDLTLSSIAQDEFGHARAMYALIWPAWEDREAGVTRRPAHQWRSCGLVELAGHPWERSLVRHFLYDLAEPLRWTSALDRFGHVADLANLVPTVLAEERFHARHATDLVVRLGSDRDGATRLQPHLDELAPLAAGMMNGEPTKVVDQYVRAIGDVLPALLHFMLPTATPGRNHRSPEFETIQEALVSVVAFDPTADW